MARLLLGVSGGIAAYKSLEFARLATLAGHGVRVLMTENAERFVGAASFEGIVGAPVLTSEFERDPMRGAFPGEPGEEGHDPIGHLELAANCDAFLVAPASANTLAKLAGGFADSMLTTSFLACTAPRLVAPAMNDRMYADAATQANLATLRERGVEVIEPGEGLLASRGERGRGRLPDPKSCWPGSKRHWPAASGRPAVETVLLGESERSAANRAARRRATPPRSMTPAGEPGPWTGLRVLVTAGGTREPIDSVRFIGNRSSGRMGMALAAAAARRGAEVTVVAANVSLPEPAGVKRIDVETTAELSYETVERFETQHVLLMAAAPADFRTEPITGKIKRQDSLNLNLQPTEDILAADRGRSRRGPDRRRLRRRARGRRGRPGPRQAGPQGRRPDRPQRRLRPDDRLRERRERGHSWSPPPTRRRSRRPPRTPSPTLSSTASTVSAPPAPSPPRRRADRTGTAI